jgi:aconitate hydratase 2/2-methylisocitrate dehydratase
VVHQPPDVPQKMTATVFKVTGETNTDDLSPAPDAWSRPDIPLHAKAMYKNPREGITNTEQQINELKKKGHPVAFVGDVVGTGSSRKSATNSVLWYTGEDIPFVPNKRFGGICIGSKIAPIFFNTMEDAGALPFECDVSKLNMGDVIDIYPYEGKIKSENGEVIAEFSLKTDVLLDEVRAGGRINLIIGRGLTDKARTEFGLSVSPVFRRPLMRKWLPQRFYIGAENGGQSLRSSGHSPGYLLRAKNDHCRFARYHRPDDT